MHACTHGARGRYAETLFDRFDDDGDGLLTFEQAQRALQHLTPPPKGGGAKPPVHFACPADAYTEAGELQLPKDWFLMLYRNMR